MKYPRVSYSLYKTLMISLALEPNNVDTFCDSVKIDMGLVTQCA